MADSLNTSSQPESTLADRPSPFDPPGLAIEIEEAKLRALGAKELIDTWQAIGVLSEVLGGLMCQPRFFDERDKLKCNAAGEILEAVDAWLSRVSWAIVCIADSSKSKSADDTETLQWLILQDLAKGCEDLSSFSANAARAAADASVVRRSSAQQKSSCVKP